MSAKRYPGVRDFLALVGCFGECTSYGYAYGAMVDNGGAESEIYVEAFAFQAFDWGRSDRNVALTPRYPNNGFPLAKGNWLVRPIPEPSTGLLLGLGITGFAVLRRRL